MFPVVTIPESPNLDNHDKEIISMLLEDGRRSLSEIGDKIGMSHVAISKRLDKLLSDDQIRIQAGVNAESLDAKILFVGIETENMDVTEYLIEKYQKCPRILTLAPVTGRYNLFAVMVVEDTWTLESIIGTCSISTEKGVRKSESWFGNAPIVPKYLPIDLSPEQSDDDISPCGRTCADCRRYEINKCVGCPPSSVYEGMLWKSDKTKPRRRSRK
ncbi:MAG: AsnC family transcriptional regulator [Candidatus Lokiarchaeota archaeon]|nr:AsnC family transcriptional regulator [Candidatus Lokiarchaeota archaeon]